MYLVSDSLHENSDEKFHQFCTEFYQISVDLICKHVFSVFECDLISLTSCMKDLCHHFLITCWQSNTFLLVFCLYITLISTLEVWVLKVLLSSYQNGHLILEGILLLGTYKVRLNQRKPCQAVVEGFLLSV